MNIEQLAKTLDSLGHPLRIRITALLAKNSEMYLNEIANNLKISRALAKVHLKKLEKAEIVKSRIEVIEGEAKARRYYQIRNFDLHISPQSIRKEVENNGQ